MHETSSSSRHANSRSKVDGMIPDVERELRAVAGRLMRSERPDHTWQPTELLSEVYLRLVRQKRLEWESRGHFIALASKLMRQVLVDHARAKNAKKRGAGVPKIHWDEGLSFARVEAPSLTTVIALDRALERLSELDEMQSRIVEMRLFGGFTIEEVACSLQVSHSTVENEMKTARLWLSRELRLR